jgi:hypothetical protein
MEWPDELPLLDSNRTAAAGVRLDRIRLRSREKIHKIFFAPPELISESHQGPFNRPINQMTARIMATIQRRWSATDVTASVTRATTQMITRTIAININACFTPLIRPCGLRRSLFSRSRPHCFMAFVTRRASVLPAVLLVLGLTFLSGCATTTTTVGVTTNEAPKFQDLGR